ncbi:phosphate acetyltransferase [Leuconostocaceae bacterium ESL0958]|nr:phosphate acetyltransferase [Leuconostocaceae bacterium ESL0958]
MDIFDELQAKIQGQKVSLVFPEGQDERVVQAALDLAAADLVAPILLGSEAQVAAAAAGRSLAAVTIIDPATVAESEQAAMIETIVERRNGKTDEATAQRWLQDVNYFGTVLVEMGQAEGLVSGATHPTGDTVRPALQLIKTAPGSKRISGAFFMQKGQQRFVFADCAININLDAQTMAEVAVQSVATAQLFGLDPKVALLSFSTKGSARGDMVDKVQEATALAKEMAPALADRIDGELQFDAAINQTVAAAKAPDSSIAGEANVFIFPSLEAGNIAYKVAQRLGDFEAYGPILQGLAKPVSDLSRGASQQDVYQVAIITAAQALAARGE